MEYQIGQSGLYEFRGHGKSELLQARIVAIRGSWIEIEFNHPVSREYARGTKTGAYPHRRWLRSRAERARFQS